MDLARIIPASEFVSRGRPFLGTEEPLAAGCPCCEATDVDTRHAHICHRAGAQVNQQHTLVHALSRTFERSSIHHQVESGAPFNADGNLRMDIVIERGGLRDATSSEYRNKAILVDVTHAAPRARVHMRVAALIETNLPPSLLRRESATIKLV